jgi:hypothetical protein
VGLFGVIDVGGDIVDVGVVNITAAGTRCVGGLVGLNEGGNIRDSYVVGSITGDECIGGLVGFNQGTVNDCNSAGSVTGGLMVGGLVGYSYGGVLNSYSTGSVAGDDYVGGLVGTDYGTVSNSYSTGSVTSDDYAGGLVGEGGYINPTDSFWDIETSGQATSNGGTGKNTTEMKDIATFTDVATEGLDEPWDMIAVASSVERNPSYIWNIVDGVTYPFLSWQPVS